MFAGHDCEIAEAGQFFTLQIGAYPIMVVRGNDGTIRAFHNSCRHRGSRICTMDHGKAKRLVCPYHQWSYDLDGSLARARHMPQDFDKSGFGLKPVHCRSVAGYIFVCVGERAPAWEPFADAAEPYLAPHRLSKAKVAFESTVVEHGNWKLVWENNRECWHCPGGHPGYVRANFDTAPDTEAIREEMSRRAADHAAALATLDAPVAQHRETGLYAFPSPGRWWSANRTPMRDGFVTESLHGRPVAPPMGDHRDPDVGTLRLRTLPNFWCHASSDHAVLTRLLPDGPGHTRIRVTWLVDERATPGRDYALEELLPFWQLTSEQDWSLCERNHTGVRNPAFVPGPYDPGREANVIAFVDWYVGRMRAHAGP
jgi:Rieske 2Fe-2S family protein